MENGLIEKELNMNDIVEKADSLIFMADDPFERSQLLLLDLYLSKINARNPEDRTVIFSKKSLEEFSGKIQIKPKTIDKQIDALMRPVTISNEEGEWDKTVLFSNSRCFKDNDGKWYISLTCSPEAKKYFFNIETIGYIKYRINNIIHLTSKYSIFLFMCFVKNSYRGTWEVSVDKLREQIHCTGAYCRNFNEFNKEILSKCMKEINEKTDISVSYTRINGEHNKTHALRFIIRHKNSYNLSAKERSSDDTSLLVTIKDLLKISEKSALSIISAAKKNDVSTDKLLECIQYVASRSNVKNATGYSIYLLSEKRYEKIDPGTSTNNTWSNFPQKDMSSLLKEMESLFLAEVNSDSNVE